jgi:hypothetical protein
MAVVEKLYPIVMAGVPLAGLLISKVIPIQVKVTAIAGQKKRGIDSFKVRVTLKNTGDLDITDWSLDVYAVTVVSGTSYTHAIAYQNISIPKGQQVDLPSSTTYFEKQVASTTPTGVYDCVVNVINAPVGQSGKIVATKTVTGAWEVVEPVKAVDIVSVTVA